MNSKVLYAAPFLLAAGMFLIQTDFVSSQLFRARDPGVRGGVPGAGGPLVTLSRTQLALLEPGREALKEAEDVTDGLGPRMGLRTDPLWGPGQGIFFLHDGRTSDRVEAMQAHRIDGSEANGVIGRFNDLWDNPKQDVLNFLRPL